ncbi:MULTISPECIES: fasciclin domain-containing protein [unclassified Chryseobacterium]|uniref:fasciclin domain-containing protein n=1 Tax=unclassified Chryseobacterium TaxID=2593645 RepID=UPI000D394542|nr:MULTISPECIES: fasciclin domain-containing protein [unclassified Chryseobacterium]PTT68709.1 fasciclin [Chryseobacterium sp. HMWF001]PVV58652.1 fasciclin domain-containing protein [Chryseobacterium sp. HMWF035]
MKNFFKPLLFSGVAMLCIISCDDNDDNMMTEKTTYELVSSDSNLSSLKAAIDKAGLSATLNQSGTFTLFAPTNAAFATFLQANGYASLNDVPTAALKTLLMNHVLNSEVKASAISTGYVSTLAMGSASSTRPISMFINTNGGVKINGVSNVVATDIDANNGVIHKVDAVIGLPTIVTHATANPQFTSLVSALTRSDMPNFVGILSGTANSPFTVFAPTNSAFSSLLTEIGAANLAAIPKTTLENTLKYHVVTGANVGSNNLTNNMMVPTFQGGSFKITTTGGAKITDNNNRVSNIIVTDVQCSNGIIHAIDKVLLP